MASFSVYIMPAIIAFVILFALVKKVAVFEVFLKGVKNGMASLTSIAPALLGLICAVSMLRASGILNAICDLASPICNMFSFPADVLPLALLRPVSGSGSLAIVNDIFKNFGTDSFTGLLASVMMGSTETTFYAIAVYFSAVGITKIRHTVLSAVCADIVGLIFAFVFSSMFFSELY